MQYQYTPKGVCSTRFLIELSDEGIVKQLTVTDGCDGNGKGMSRLVMGRPADELIALLDGIRCGRKKTSCPDQFAKALAEIRAQGRNAEV